MARNNCSTIFDGIFAFPSLWLHPTMYLLNVPPSVFPLFQLLSPLNALFFSQDKSLFTPLLKTYFNAENQVEEVIITNILRTISRLCHSWTGFEGISAKLGAVSYDSIIRLYEKCLRTSDEFNVLCHGDMWMNNFLYRYDAGGLPNQIQLVSVPNIILDLVHYSLYVTAQ